MAEDDYAALNAESGDRGFDRRDDGNTNSRADNHEQSSALSSSSSSRPQSTKIVNKYGVTSFINDQYDSEDVKKIISLYQPEQKTKVGDVRYKRKEIFPDWLLETKTFNLKDMNKEKNNDISVMFHTPISERTSEQTQNLIYWLMSVWPTASDLGYKQCDAMLKVFKLVSFKTNEYVFKENDRGLTFFIIVDGEVAVLKDGIGKVASLGKGKSFGEIALTQGKDLRTASIQASTSLDLLSLHKIDYDRFVRDFQLLEKRENLNVLKNCKLFHQWSRIMLHRLAHTVSRKTFQNGTYIFRQGDAPDFLYVIIDGSVGVVKEVNIVCKNRWPTSINTWDALITKKTRPFVVQTLTERGDYFGEISILKDDTRQASVLCNMKTTLLLIDRLEFIHLLDKARQFMIQTALSAQMEQSRDDLISRRHIQDKKILQQVDNISGGPTSSIRLGNVSINPNKVEKKHEAPPNYADPLSHGIVIDNVKIITSDHRPNKNSLNKNGEKKIIVRIVPPSLQSIDLSRIVNADDYLKPLDVTLADTSKVKSGAARLSPLSSIRKSLKQMRKYSTATASKDSRLKINNSTVNGISNTNNSNSNHNNSFIEDYNSVIYSAIQRDLPMYRNFKMGSLDGFSSNPSLISVVTNIRPSTSNYLQSMAANNTGDSDIDNYHASHLNQQSLGSLSDYNWHVGSSLFDGEMIMPTLHDTDINNNRTPLGNTRSTVEYSEDMRVEKMNLKKLKPVLAYKAKLTYRDVIGHV